MTSYAQPIRYADGSASWLAVDRLSTILSLARTAKRSITLSKSKPVLRQIRGRSYAVLAVRRSQGAKGGSCSSISCCGRLVGHSGEPNPTYDGRPTSHSRNRQAG